MIQPIPSTAHILALHGFTGEGADFAALSSLVGGCWHCPDLPGHGDFPNASPEEFSWEHLESRFLHPLPKNKIGVGYSMGGRILLHLALRNPSAFERIVLISASPGLPTPSERDARRRADAKWIRLLQEKAITGFLEKWWEQPVLRTLKYLPPELSKSLFFRRKQNSPEGLVRSLQHHGTGALDSLWEKLPHLTVPVLICTGANDEKFQTIAHAMTRKLPSAQHAVIPKCGHAPHWEAPKETATAISNFIRPGK